MQMVKSAGARTFGDMASRYYETITSSLIRNCDRVDVEFDRYDKQDSIKESERRRRGSCTSFEVAIASGSTSIPKKWNSYIANPLNKVNLQTFLAKSWTEIGKRMLGPGHQLVLAGCFQDPQDAVVIERGTSRTLPVLS